MTTKMSWADNPGMLSASQGNFRRLDRNDGAMGHIISKILLSRALAATQVKHPPLKPLRMCHFRKILASC